MRLASRVLLALTPLLPGCPAESEPRSEAAELSRVLDSLRNADNAAKSAHVATLRATACSVVDVCAVRSTCLSGYELHARALEGLARAMATAGDGGPGRAGEILDEARRDLDRARKLTERCTSEQGRMVRKYRVGG